MRERVVVGKHVEVGTDGRGRVVVAVTRKRLVSSAADADAFAGALLVAAANARSQGRRSRDKRRAAG